MSDKDILGDELRQAMRIPDREPPADRVSAVRAAAASAAPRHRFGLRSLPQLMLAAAAIVALALVGWLALRPGESGELEYGGGIASADGSLVGDLEIRRTGIGRVVNLTTDDLEILPTGEFYEVWFVGPGDAPDAVNRISAGTFHPDEDGRSDVTLTAAVDPEKYPAVAITAEPGDGDPAPSGPDLMRVELD